MLNWAITFFIVAFAAAVFGFTGVATQAVGVARMVCCVFALLFVLSLVSGLGRRV